MHNKIAMESNILDLVIINNNGSESMKVREPIQPPDLVIGKINSVKLVL